MKANLVEITIWRLQCPHCGEAGHCGIDHLKPGQRFGPWYCDRCGRGIQGRINADGSADIELTKDRTHRLWVLLRFYAEEGPLYLVLDVNSVHVKEGEPIIERDGMDYLYSEHICPSDLFSSVEQAVVVEDNCSINHDPHGVFEFIDAIPYVETVYPIGLFKLKGAIRELLDETKPANER